MKKSFYNFYVKDKDHVLLYNSLNGTSVILKEKEFADFQNFICNSSDINFKKIRILCRRK